MHVFIPSVLKRSKRWAIAAVLLVAVSFPFITAQRALAADGRWINAGAISYVSKTYLNQGVKYKSSAGSGGVISVVGTGQVYAPENTGSCNDKDNWLTYFDFLEVKSDTTATHYVVDQTKRDNLGNLTCEFKSVTNINLVNQQGRHTWFFREGDIVYTYDRAHSFTKIANRGPNGEEIFTAGGGACVDILAHNTGSNVWTFFPMGGTTDVANTFPQSAGAKSETYDALLNGGGRYFNNCRVNSLEVGLANGYRLGTFATEQVTYSPGPIFADTCEELPDGTPQIIKFDWRSNYDPSNFDVNVPRYVLSCEVIKRGALQSDQSRYTYVSASNGLAQYNSADFQNFGFDDGYRIMAGVSNEVPDGTPVTTPTQGTPGSAAARPTCSITDVGAGWLLCAAALLVDKVVTTIQGWITDLLDVRPLSTSGSGAAVYQIWDAFRNIANIAFIIAFMIIIFSQATSVGISNYGIKKLLPKLILVAILTNISFFIMAGAIDLFNVLGAGIKSFVESFVSSSAIPVRSLLAGASTTAQIEMTGIGAGIITAMLAVKGIEGIIVLLIIGVVVLIAAFVALIIRQVLILAMVLLAPLALVAWILPNTENMFKKWMRFTLQLLIMYPMIVLVFAAGQLFAHIIVSMDIQDPTGGAVKLGAALVAKWGVLGLIPFLFAAGGFAMGWMIRKGGQLAQGAGKQAENSRIAQARRNAREQRKQLKFLDRATVGKGVRARMTRAALYTGVGSQTRTELNENLYSAQEKLREQRRGNMRGAIGAQAGAKYAALYGLMENDNVDAFMSTRYKQLTGNEVDSIQGQEARRELTRLVQRFGGSTGSTDTAIGALLAAHETGSSVSEVRELTAHVAARLLDEKGGGTQGVLQVNNDMIRIIDSSAKSNGFAGLGYAGLDDEGNYNDYAIKLPRDEQTKVQQIPPENAPPNDPILVEAARKTLASISIQGMETGQIVDAKGNLTSLGYALIEDANSDNLAVRLSTAQKIAGVLRDTKAKHVKELETVVSATRPEVQREITRMARGAAFDTNGGPFGPGPTPPAGTPPTPPPAATGAPFTAPPPGTGGFVPPAPGGGGGLWTPPGTGGGGTPGGGPGTPPAGTP